MDALAFYVLSLIANLGDPSFQTRQEASKNLAALGEIAHVPLARAKLHDPDPEVRMRARVLIEDWRSSFRPTKSPVSPWLDCLPNDYPCKSELVQRILRSLRGDFGYMDYDYDANDWPIYRYATNVFVDELIAAGTSRKEIVQLLDRMSEQEAKYWRQRGEPELIPGPGN